ncbi:MAG: response regulator transcription factor [Inhella sp.]
MSNSHVLVVEDDPDTQELLIDLLQGAGLRAAGLASGEALLRRLDAERPDLVLLDVALPGMSGLEACRQLRQRGETLPILLLTARDEEADRVLGLELGADDHLGKPFSGRELLARVRARLRGQSRQTRTLSEPMQLGDWCLQLCKRQLRHRDGRSHSLGELEWTLLSELLAHPGQVLSRARLLQSLPGPELQPRSVDAAMHRLRAVLEPEPCRPRWLCTLRGRGYVYQP